MTDPEGPLPAFLIIGAQKGATRWLRANLGLHPDIYVVSQELWFFNDDIRFHEWGLDWYRAQFEGSNDAPFVGEATPGYTMPRHDPKIVAGRISRIVPDVRLVAILRNPIDRANSALLHQIRRNRLPRSTRLLDYVRTTDVDSDRFELVAAGRYASVLQPYVDRFGDQLLVLFQDDIATDAAGVYRDALAHIGAPTSFIPADLTTVRYSNQGHKAARGRDLTHEERLELYEHFRSDIEELGPLLGRDLSRWDPASMPGAVAST